MWTVSSGDHPEVSGGYTFTKNWRATLPGTIHYGLGLINFVASPQKIISYQTLISSISTTTSEINFNPVGYEAGFKYLYFSILIITEENNFVELVSLQGTTTSSSKGYSLTGSSTKFTFGGTDDPTTTQFFDWVTG